MKKSGVMKKEERKKEEEEERCTHTGIASLTTTNFLFILIWLGAYPLLEILSDQSCILNVSAFRNMKPYI